MHDDTLLSHTGTAGPEGHGLVNPPVARASTILFPSLDALEGRTPVRMTYGRHGTATHAALAEALTALEGGAGTLLVPSGLAACALALQALVRAGDHVLVADSVYAPTRVFCNEVLARFGVETTYYDPLIGAGIAGLLRPNTRLVFCESPGSQTFEVQDLPAIVAAAHAAGARVAVDNTWGAGYWHKPLALGADVSIQAVTKYIGGHSDLLMGALICNEATLGPLRAQLRWQGNNVSADDAALALRGLRTLGVRLRQHQAGGLAVAQWLRAQPQVARVLHPALPDDPGHALWRRDFSGACGLFGVELRRRHRAGLAALLEGLELFGMGYSWGGFESLIVPAHPLRSVRRWEGAGTLLRLHVGLEDPADLIADLAAGLARFDAAA
ncbi:cystathionine beta-lyase [Plasticicumulans lactativorans]|uniref:Cystathionine beta-lyase n=1 Tax=Plasticicumulans lactativorans TaxID=1133106 RepID=A0A4R2L1M8_9GAMM|nr:cystathionine beta-lyase [Plasticicumulans lactativorans]TCO80354.1 cystathionine beta-lyase [Plasticicumulans lactativorans]